MLVTSFPVGMLQCNCTIVACPKTREALVCDPGGDAERILEHVEAQGYRVVRIVHTHAHFDHIGATEAVRSATEAPTYLHSGDTFLVETFQQQGLLLGLRLDLGPSPTIDHDLGDGAELRFGEQCALAVHTPGHTPGSMCFSLRTPDGMLLLSGDTLFRQGIGRTDFPGGDYDTLQGSLRDRVLSLEDATRVIPGHGPETTVGYERRMNPFLQ